MKKLIFMIMFLASTQVALAQSQDNLQMAEGFNCFDIMTSTGIREWCW